MSLLVFLSLLFVVYGAGTMGMILLVISVHELGHYLGMRWFDYHDVRIYFLPLGSVVGAATVGAKEKAPVWQETIVTFLGPLPGLVAGCLLWLWLQERENPLLRELAVWLVALNLLNLLPLEPLDGGQLINLILFYRAPVLEGVVLVASGVAIGLLGSMLFSSYVLLGLGVLILLELPCRFWAATAARNLMRRWPDLPLEIKNLTQTQLRDTFREVLRNFPQADLNSVVTSMLEVHERAAVQPLSWPVKGGFLAIYAGAIWLAFFSGVAMAVPDAIFPNSPKRQQEMPGIQEPAFRPADPPGKRSPWKRY